MDDRVCLPARTFNDRRIRGCHLRILAAISELNEGVLSHRAIGGQCGIGDRELRRQINELSDYGYLAVVVTDGKASSYSIVYNDIKGGDKTTPEGKKNFTESDDLVSPPDVPLPLPPDPLTLTPLNPPASPVKVARATRLPIDWQPSPANIAYAESKGFFGDRLARQVEDFRDYWHARAGPNALKLDWNKTWATWIRKAADYARPDRDQRSHANALDALARAALDFDEGEGNRGASEAADRPARRAEKLEYGCSALH